ncbi:MAG TPA: double-strand break repair helicase AddA [Hyphomicrobium sp.]|uniref:double-strand break repair helicase AddA n=1 Tax=Hyphomicrobium sp. TaxID=82 RepID=UPI002B57DF19|nr:double-strand break repair helicase AddA [Hyphomicrobium sp.]HXE00554.1 double-strand break repair helicase AddA [Hyphomicrobium sp.]
MNLETKKLPADALRQLTDRAQSDAADPNVSAWVNANAGTGKTHVLTLRVLRLLLASTSPERILCLTYTKAAASEMSKRVFDWLAGWVTADDATLRKELGDVMGTRVSDADIEFARTLFARAIETPGGLKVQTVHAFAERLLQRFPLEAGVPPDFKILDEDAARDLKAQAIERTLIEATAAPSTSLGKALDVVVRYAADAQFDTLISNAVAERRWLEAISGQAFGKAEDALGTIESFLRQSLKVRAGIDCAEIHRECAGVLSKDDIREICAALSTGTTTDEKNADLLRSAVKLANAQARADKLSDYFLVEKGEAKRKNLMTAAVGRTRHDLLDRCQQAQQRFFDLSQELKALMLIEASAALYRLAGAVLQRYTDARSAAGALDFDDLILKTTSLLSGEHGEAQWVLFKLDGGLDHILVDEAQDTSPEQWQIVSSLVREFFAGTGTSAVCRTVFAVGDEKQSIYSFQGAAPKMFAETGDRFKGLALSALMQWKSVSLNLSFRTVAPILGAVDQVFSDAIRTPGLTASGRFVPHAANRFGQAGLVEIWPTEKPDDTVSADPWAPLSDTSERSPANRLADRIADQIKRWIDGDERLISEDRPIRAGDILILVRKRNPFAVPMVAALKRRGIAVAGSDRIALTDQIAVQDLIVLGDFLTLPEDDLALATVLKGPMFGLDDDDLLAIAPGRTKTLWGALLDNADAKPAYKVAVETLKRWRAKADFTPPFEFFSSILDRDGGREKMLSRLGPEAADAIDEFLDLALRFDDGAPPSLTQFLAKLRASEPEVKRDMDHGRNEVRVMTVHGAKGLEAPIVFLPDTCTIASGGNSTAGIVKLSHLTRPDGLPDPVVWTVKGTTRIDHVQTARRERDERDREERNRLLYVAMTRARDRLYIAGFEGKRGRADGCWYDLIFDALKPGLTEVDLGDGQLVWRNETRQTADPEKSRKEKSRQPKEEERPAFATHPAQPEPKLLVPLAPSRLEPYAPDAEGEPLMPAKRDAAATNDGPSPLSGNVENRFLRGTLTHALLQHLPAVPEAQRETIAKAFIDKRGQVLNAKTRAGIVRETLAILTEPGFAALFGPNSVAEVPIAAVIPRPRGKGPGLDLSGQIDRLAVTDDHVLIVDYKTNRPPPSEVRFVADAYLYQLAAYRLALAEIYPRRLVRAALLWTDGPRLMEIPTELLDSYTERLWDLDVASLDAT